MSTSPAPLLPRTDKGLYVSYALVLAACSAPLTTARQESTMDHVESCLRHGPTVQLARVNPDGSLTLTGQATDLTRVKRCLTERYGYRWASELPKRREPRPARDLVVDRSAASSRQ